MMKRNITINPNHMFSGALAFLSNMYPCTITIDVLGQPFTFTSAEAAFQAGKCLDLTDVRLFTNVANGAAAKKTGTAYPSAQRLGYLSSGMDGAGFNL